MRQLFAVLCLFAFAACEPQPEEQPMSTPGFFSLPADKLGTTAIVAPNPTIGRRGEPMKLLDLSIPDNAAQSVVVSVRSEYSVNQATVSQTIAGPMAISGATNAAPIVITTPQPHGLVTGQNISLNGVGGNVAANGAWTVTVLTPTTFSLNGSDGTLSGAYTLGGTFTTASPTGTGTGLNQLGSPLVGILQWGVGGAQNQLEFDIPCPKTADLILPTAFPQSQPMNNLGSGSQVKIAASHISLYVRNDASISPLNNPGNDIIASGTPAKVTAFVGPGEVSTDKIVSRSIVMVGGVSAGGHGLLMNPGDIVGVTVPPFAKRVMFMRNPIATALRVDHHNNIGFTYRENTVGVNDDGWIDLDAMVLNIYVTNQSAVAIDHLLAFFDVTP